jgi:uncharacterized protein HemY
MDPLTPEDLLIRQKPVDDDSWFEGRGAEEEASRPAVALERFQTLEQIIRQHPIHVDPYLELARIYLGRSRWTDARRILGLAVERFPDSEEANFLREEAQINRSLQLLEESQNAHAAEPTRLTQDKLERCHIELNALREKVCRSRLQRHPDQVELYLPLATALENLGKSEQAIECLQTAVLQPALRARAALQLGKLLERAKRVPEALSAYRRAAMFRVPPAPDEIKLNAITAAANLAENYGLIDSAIRYLEMLRELQPNNKVLQQRIERLQNTPL